jgi:ribosomal protein S27E
VSVADDRIPCRGCGRNIVPRLWHYGGGRLSYATTQHLCPFCGVVLYETGGGVRWGCVIILLLFTLPFIVLFVFTFAREVTKEFSR